MDIALRHEDLEEPLRAALVVDERAAGLGEGGRGQDDLGSLRRRVLEMIEDDHVLGREKLGGSRGIHAAEEVVLGHDDRVGARP